MNITTGPLLSTPPARAGNVGMIITGLATQVNAAIATAGAKSNIDLSGVQQQVDSALNQTQSVVTRVPGQNPIANAIANGISGSKWAWPWSWGSKLPSVPRPTAAAHIFSNPMNSPWDFTPHG
jgi:hypothetical protein